MSPNDPHLPPPDLFYGTVNTLVLLASAVPNEWVERAAERLELRPVRIGLLVCLGFAAAFLAIRIFEFLAALAGERIHALQHLSFLAVALLFWWALIHSRRGLMGYGAAVLYVFTTSMHSGALGALLTFAPASWYPAYAETTASWGLTPVEDQQLAGLIMWVPTGVIYLFAGLALFAGWLHESDANGRQSEGHALPQPHSMGMAKMEGAPRTRGVVNRVVLGALLVILVGLSSCNRDVAREAAELTGGDPEPGLVSMRQHGCPACHTIPGVPGAYGLVGQPLGGIASRMYIAGVLPNTPENMIR
jgi:Cytochrome c oxidase caa3 assembly factor (Caa3_CtaG)